MQIKRLLFALPTAALLIGPLSSALAQDEGRSRYVNDENPGYLHGGLNLQNNGRGTTNAGLVIGLGAEYYFGDYVAGNLRFGLNAGWFNVAANFGGRKTSLELQTPNPGFLFSADLSENSRLDFKYSIMPTLRGRLAPNFDDGSIAWGITHGPYLGFKSGKFMAGIAYVAGKLEQYDSEVDTDDTYRIPANTLRLLVGLNY